MGNQAKMKIEIWSDVMCPFCYIGKRNHESALNQFADNKQVEVIWKSFQLDPTIPQPTDTSQNTLQYLTDRKGMSYSQVENMTKGITQAAKNIGLEYHLDKTLVTNTFNAHKLIQFAKTKGLGDLAEEKLFYAYFTEAKDIANPKILEEIGEKIGLSAEEVNESLTNELYTRLVEKDIEEAQNIGVTGVPFFVFNRKYAISGAQPPEAFLETLKKSFSEWEEENGKVKLSISDGQACTPDGNCD